jgi:GTP-binding protein
MTTVVIAGRPNVGKSTLFNRLLGESRSIVHNQPGVTRDSVVGRILLDGKSVRLVDTGGYAAGSEPGEIQDLVENQVRRVLDEASVVVLVLDARAGLLPADSELASFLRKSGKPVIGVLNKVDPDATDLLRHEFYRLGISPLIEISAEHKLGLETLKEAISQAVSGAPAVEKIAESSTSVAFVGRPNVGKSSLINRILKEPRLLVSKLPGTTRDVIDVLVEKEGRKYLLLDTAGLRRKPKMSGTVEEFSAVRSMRAVERADVVVLLLDASQQITAQDARVAAAIVEKGRGLLLAANKWDLLSDNPAARKNFREDIYAEAPFLRFAALKFVSAKTGMGADQILTEADGIRQRGEKRFTKAELEEIFDAISSGDQPGGRHGGRMRLFSLSQADEGKGMTFFLWCNDPRLSFPELERYWRTALNRALRLEGVPIGVTLRRKPPDGRRKNRSPLRKTKSPRRGRR